MKLEKLLEPFSIGKMELRNRIVMPPMATGYCTEMGEVTDRLRDFIEARARGGVGLIITEMAPVEGAGSTKYTSLMVERDERIPGLRTLADTAHKHGAKIAVQICHGEGSPLQKRATGWESRRPGHRALHYGTPRAVAIRFAG